MPDVRVLLVGGTDRTPEQRTHFREVQTMLAEAGVTQNFVFAGFRADVDRLLGSLDAFVLSTHWEGLPLVLLEAMAQSCAVIPTAVDGIPEVIVDGETGLLHGHGDDEQLAAQILRLLNDPMLAARLGLAGRKWVEQRFSRQQFAACMGNLYRSMLDAA